MEKKLIMSAQRLLEGDTVYFTGADWSLRFLDARLYDKASISDAQARADADVKANLVISLEVVDVTVEDGVIKPVRTREAVRAIGPTVGTETGSTKLYEPTAQSWKLEA